MAENGFAEWGGYMEAKITKLEEQFSAASAPFRKSNLFAGISIYVNGLTNPSADELKRIMMVHGGTYHHYERSHTTYIIASNLPDVKVRNMDTSKIISAKWVIDSIAENRIMDYTKYLLYTNQKTTQPRLNFNMPKKEKPPDKQPSTDEVAKIMEDLAELNAKMREIVPESVKNDIQIEEKVKQQVANTSTARTAVDPNFLPEFYNNSRLHHIATLGAGFKQYITELREKHPDNEFPARAKLREKLIQTGVENINENCLKLCINSVFIMHIDMDCFFVSVGLRNYPQLRGKPVAVTHSKGGSGATDVPVHPNANREVEMALFVKRFEQHAHNNILSDKVQNGFDAKMSLSEIASCSYEARSKGIRNGMFVGQAIKLCPELKTIPYDFEAYKEVAFTLYDTIAQYTLKIEAVSCDEMFVDLSDIIAELKILPIDFVQAVRNEVREKTGCPCSAGIGANKLQARMATRRAKPDGQYQLEAVNVMEYMSDIPVGDLPGVGSSTSYVLKQNGYSTCKDLQTLSLIKLQSLVGKKSGETLYQFCRGLDDRPLNYEQVRKSVSAEVNYGIRFKEYTEVENFLRQLCGEVHSRLCQIKRKTKCITLKVMVRAADAPVETSKFMGHGVCDYITKSESLVNFTNELDVVTRIILKIMKNLNIPPNELRGIGIQLTKLDQPKEANRETKENSIKNMFAKLKEKQPEVPKQPSENLNEDNFKQIEFKDDPPQIIDTPDPAALKPTAKKRKNVLGMLQEAYEKKQKSISNNNENQQQHCIVSSTNENYEYEEQINLPANIDPEVFAALPSDIRQEILNDIGPQLILAKPTTSANHTVNNKYNTMEKIESKDNTDPTLLTSQSPLKQSNENSNSALLAIDEDSELDLEPSTSRAAEERRERKRLQKSQAQNQIEAQTQNLTDFLQALPLDLRSEIEADMAAQIPKTTTNIDLSLKGNVSAEMSRVTYNFTKTTTITTASTTTTSSNLTSSSLSLEENIFMQPNCNELLLQWLNSNPIPNSYDVDLCCRHAREMARNNNHYLTILYGSIAYFRKLIDKKQSTSDDNAWFKAYCDILKCIVDEVDAHYPGRNLLTRDMHLNMPNK